MKDVTIERSYNVIKSNDLIRHSRYDLSLVEQKIILRLIQLIKPQDKEFNEYHLMRIASKKSQKKMEAMRAKIKESKPLVERTLEAD